MTRYVGEEFVTNQGYKVEVLEYKNCKDVLIKFLESGEEVCVTLYNLKNGSVRNRLHPSCHGVGYLGFGEEVATIGGKSTKIYKIWNSMLGRCYPKFVNVKSAYHGCSVHEDWHNFQNFSRWYREQVGSGLGWHLDKDIRVRGNKVYSEDTCCLVPPEINTLLTNRRNHRGGELIGVRRNCNKFEAGVSVFGVRKYLGLFETEHSAFLAYKSGKEAVIKECALKYSDILPKEIFECLMSYEVCEED